MSHDVVVADAGPVQTGTEKEDVEGAGESGGSFHFELPPGGDSSVGRTSAGASALPTCSLLALVASETSSTGSGIGSVENQPPAGVAAAALSPSDAGDSSSSGQPNIEAGASDA